MEKSDLRKMFGAEVKRRRTELGLSQEELAERADLHRTYVSDVESGKRNPSLASIQRLAGALGAPLSVVFGSAEGTALRPAPGRVDGHPAAADRTADILLADGDAKTTQITLAVFRRLKLTNRVLAVRNGEEVLDYIFCRGAHATRVNRRFPQVVLLDLDLPKLAGLEVLRQLKADHRTRLIPIVPMSGLPKDRRAKEAARLGGEVCLLKPLTFDSFSQIMPKLSFSLTLFKPETPRFL
jgi:two-component system response regulator